MAVVRVCWLSEIRRCSVEIILGGAIWPGGGGVRGRIVGAWEAITANHLPNDRGAMEGEGGQFLPCR